MTFRLSLIATFALTASCGQVAKIDNNRFSYSINDNGCATGEHGFSSMYAMCNALKDDALNHGCAASDRARKAEESNCPKESQWLF